MFKKSNIMVLDTETATLFDSVYDLGWLITDKKGNVSKRENFLIKEIFTNGEKMTKAHFAKKVFTHYAEMLESGKIKMLSFADIMAKFKTDLCRVDTIAAYNLAFDLRVLEGTNKQLGNRFPIIPKKMRKLDIWHFVCETKLNKKTYHEFAQQNGWVSDAGNVSTTAECAYKYITGQWDFIEDHTALSDCEIETEILARCFALKKAIPYRFDKLQHSPWKIAQALA